MRLETACLVSLSLLATSNSFAQDKSERPSSQEIRKRLASDNLKDIAWGAWFASRSRSPALAKPLTQALARARGDEPSNHCATLAILDALIQLDARIEQKTVNNFDWKAPHIRNSSIVLMARSPRPHESALLEILKTTNGTAAVAAGNLLVAMRSRQVAPVILDGLQLRMTVHLKTRDQGPVSLPTTKPRDRPSCLGVFFGYDVPAGFPPIGIHDLLLSREGGSRLIADGDVPVSTKRRLDRETYPHRPEFVAADSQRLHWTASLLKTSAARLRIKHDSEINLVWSSKPRFARDMRREHKKLLEEHRSLVHRLSKMGLCSIPADSITPKIRFRVIDRRFWTTPKIPRVPGLEIEVSYR